MTQRLHLVFGGELVTPSENTFKDVSKIHVVGIFPNYKAAYNAWKAEAQRTVDNAHMRYFIAHLHRLQRHHRGYLTESVPVAVACEWADVYKELQRVALVAVAAVFPHVVEKLVVLLLGVDFSEVDAAEGLAVAHRDHQGAATSFHLGCCVNTFYWCNYTCYLMAVFCARLEGKKVFVSYWL